MAERIEQGIRSDRISISVEKKGLEGKRKDTQIPEKEGMKKKGDLYLSGKYTCIIMHCIPIENLKNILEGL